MSHKHYYVSSVVRTTGGSPGMRCFVVMEVCDSVTKEFVPVWTRRPGDEAYIEARRDANRIAEGLNLLEERDAQAS